MAPTMSEIVRYSILGKPFVIRANAPAHIIEEAKRVNKSMVSRNIKPMYHFEDETLNDDDKIDYSKPVYIA